MELGLTLGSGHVKFSSNITNISNSNRRLLLPSAAEGDDAVIGVSSPISAASSFEMNNNKRSPSGDETTQNDCKKKLRLSKDQSAFLEESYKEHNTLSPVSIISCARHPCAEAMLIFFFFLSRNKK